MKAFVCDPLWPSLITEDNKEKLKHHNIEIILDIQPQPLRDLNHIRYTDHDKIIAINPDYVKWSIEDQDLIGVKNLKALITQSTSYGWIDIDYASRNNIAVMNTRNFSTDAVADWAILMMLNVMRKVPLMIKNDFPLNFGSDFETYQGRNITGKKAGIIGMGNIGHAIAKRCAGLGMDVFYWNRSAQDNPYKRLDTISEIFSECDVIFPVLADTKETKTLITDDMLKTMNKKSVFVSIAHNLYNHDLVLDLATNGKIWGYGFEDKPDSFNAYKGNVWAAPAYAWCTDGSLRQSMDQFVDLICEASKGHYQNKVN